MKKRIIFSIVLLCILTIWNNIAYAEIIESEKEVIQLIIEHSNMEKKPNGEICDWEFIVCYESHITELNLSEKGFEDLPPEIGQLTQLTQLDLSENKLKKLPETIGNLENLTSLNLNMNLLSTLPKTFGQLINLSYLNLGENQLGEPSSDSTRKRQRPHGHHDQNNTDNQNNHQPTKLPLDQLQLLPSLKTLIMDNNKLKHLPFNINEMKTLEILSLSVNSLTRFSIIKNPPYLKKLNLSQNEISSLPENMRTFSSLQELDLSYNHLDTISDGIGQLTALTSLSLSCNVLSSVSSEIGLLKSLKTLSLETNLLTELPDSFGQLTMLERLTLSINNLKELPANFHQLKNLLYLDVSNNQLEKLPAQFSQLVKLQTLFLSSNKLKDLPLDFGNLENLCYLYASSNALTKTLTESFGNLTSIKEVDLSNNNLNSLPSTFGKLDTLQTLNLSSNKIQSLPYTFGNLDSLRYFYASSNAFGKTLAESVGNLKSIQEINLSNNKIDSLPTTFGNLDTLQILNLSSNNLIALPINFGELNNLQTVNLSNNKIKELKADFGDLSFLSHLYLSNNKLEKLPPQMGELNSLTYLDLSHNEIEEIPKEFGSKLDRLFTLNLSYNNLKMLPAEFGAMKNLRTLLLKNNEFEKFPEIVLLLTDLLFLDLSNNPKMTGYIPFNFKNLEDLTDLYLENTSVYTYSQKMADFINDKCRTCNFSPPEPNKITSDDNTVILESITSTTDELRYFKVDDIIDIVLMFNKPVKLEGGDVIVTFNTGYTSTISPFDFYTKTVNFTYTIRPGDNTEALNVSQVYLLGGSLTDANERNANLDLLFVDATNNANLSSNKILPIDGVPPLVSITQPESGQCVDTLDKIKGTAYDKFDIKDIEVTISSYTQTTKPAQYELKINNNNFFKEWVVDISNIEWQNNDTQDGQQVEKLQHEDIQAGNSESSNSDPGTSQPEKPEKFELKENVTYTINVKVLDNVENESITQTTFTYKKQKSEISCNLSSSQITIGESLTITGVIVPTDSSIPDVRIEMTSEKGFVTTKKISANRDGSFSYTTECSDFDFAGLWYIKTIFDGGTCIYGSESDAQSLTIVKAPTELILSITEDAIKKSDTFFVSGKLVPSIQCGSVLSGLDVLLNISGPRDIMPMVIGATIGENSDRFVTDEINLSKRYENQNIVGHWAINAYFPETDSYSSSTSQRMSVEVLESAGYAIIVQGKVSNGEGLASHQKTSDFVYNQFISRGLLDVNDDEDLNDIQYFSYASPGESGYTYIDNAPSKALVKESITFWAKNKMNAHPGTLYIVMVDHGLENQFLMDDEVITSSELAAWQDTLQNELSGPAQGKGIVTILGFCYSGSFIDELSGANRIIITSAAENEFSYKGPLDEDNIREGEYFISEFFKKIALGRTIRECFEVATVLTEKFTSDLSNYSVNGPPYYDNSPQHPLLDDNADGKGSNSLDSTNSDGFFSSNKVIGVSNLTSNDSGDVELEAVTETKFLGYDETPSDPFLWAQVKYDKRLLSLWVEIKKPSYSINTQPGSGQKEVTLSKIPTDTFEWNGSDLASHFDEPGIYQIFYFAKDVYSNNVSEFMDSIVYKDKENNQSPEPFSLISPQDGIQISTKGIIFNCTNDSNTNCYTVFSWEETQDPDNDQMTYTLVLSKGDDTFSDPVKNEMLQNNSISIDLPETWEGTDIYWKVQAIDQYGAIQESPVFQFSTMSVTNPDTGTIKGYVYDSVTNEPIYRAIVNLDTFRMRTSSRGYYNGCLEPKLYENLSVVADNYKTLNLYSVNIDNGIILEKNISLEPETSDIKGDINGDYTIDLFDLISGIQILADIDTSSINLLADTNEDTMIGIEEIIYIINFLGNNNK